MGQEQFEMASWPSHETLLELTDYAISATISDERLLFITEDETRVLRCPVCCDLAKAISRGNRWGEISSQLAYRYSEDQIKEALATLIEHGIVRRGPALGCSQKRAFYESLKLECNTASVALQQFGSQDHDLLPRLLDANGLQLDEDAGHLIVATDDYLRPELAEINVRETRPWLLAKPIGHTIWIGPLIVPGRTACWACLAYWLKMNRWRQAAFFGWDENDFPPQPSLAALPSTLAAAAGMIATVATIWAARGSYETLETEILAQDLRTMRLARHPLRRRPQCATCGRGGDGVRPRNLYEFISPATGIVSTIDVTDNPIGGFFHARGRFVLPLPTPGSRQLLEPNVSAGRGLTVKDAEQGCIAEAIERYSATYQGAEPQIRKLLNELAGVAPNQILLFSAAQYQNRDEWNRTHSEAQWVPEPFDPAEPINWTAAGSLVSGNTVFVPSGCAYLWYPFPRELRYCIPDSNGCASGTSRQEATLHGLLELIERDAVAVWWYNRIRRPRVEIESFGYTPLLEARKSFKALGRELYILDLRSDLDVSVYVAIAPKRDGSEPFFGCAAHVSPRIAATKAVAELSQIWFWHAHGSPDPEIDAWVRTATVQSQDYLEPEGAVTSSDCDSEKSTAEALDYCINRVAAVGIEPLLVDLTRSDIAVPTVRVIAPGLRHIWARFGRGRLYDVPVKMGWRAKPIAETELNPVACFL